MRDFETRCMKTKDMYDRELQGQCKEVYDWITAPFIPMKRVECLNPSCSTQDFRSKKKRKVQNRHTSAKVSPPSTTATATPGTLKCSRFLFTSSSNPASRGFPLPLNPPSFTTSSLNSRCCGLSAVTACRRNMGTIRIYIVVVIGNQSRLID